MARYSGANQTAAGSTLTLLLLTGGATVRPTIYSWTLGSDATPADLAGEFTIQRSTAVGGGGSGSTTETALDSLTVAATGVIAGGPFTSAPTVTASSYLKMVALNQRATYEWNANPGDELIAIASANNGFSVYSVAHGGTPNMNTCIHWYE